MLFCYRNEMQLGIWDGSKKKKVGENTFASNLNIRFLVYGTVSRSDHKRILELPFVI